MWLLVAARRANAALAGTGGAIVALSSAGAAAGASWSLAACTDSPAVAPAPPTTAHVLPAADSATGATVPHSPVPSYSSTPSVHGVGGHDGIMQGPRVGDGGNASHRGTTATVLKPLQRGIRGRTEEAFYETEFNSDHPSVPHRFLPRYYGTVEASQLELGTTGGAGDRYLMLQDITDGMRRPCVADIKIGTKTWRDGTLDTKIQRVLYKYPYQALLGFRFTGMAVYRPHAQPGGGSSDGGGGGGDGSSGPATTGCAAAERKPARWRKQSTPGTVASAGTEGGDGYCHLGRYFGWSLTPDTAVEGFREFLWDGRRVRLELVPPLLAQVRDLRRWFERQRSYRFYSSSLLLVYDGDPAPSHPRGSAGGCGSVVVGGGRGAAGPASSGQPEVGSAAAGAGTESAVAPSGEATPLVRMRMIDFAHAIPQRTVQRPGGAMDASYLHGLARMEAVLEGLLMAGEDRQTRSEAGGGGAMHETE